MGSHTSGSEIAAGIGTQSRPGMQRSELPGGREGRFCSGRAIIHERVTLAYKPVQRQESPIAHFPVSPL